MVVEEYAKLAFADMADYVSWGPDSVRIKESAELPADAAAAVAATNKPWLLDDAVLSRFARTVYVALPTDEARRELFRLSIGGQGHTCEASWEELAAVSDGQSGREIAVACKEAARNMLLRANPELDDKVDEGAAAIRSYRLRTLPIAESEIVEALSRVRPATSPGASARYASWRGEQ